MQRRATPEDIIRQQWAQAPRAERQRHEAQVRKYNTLLDNPHRTRAEEKECFQLGRVLARENGNKLRAASSHCGARGQPRDWHGRFAEKPMTKGERQRTRKLPDGYTSRKRVKRRKLGKVPRARYRKQTLTHVKSVVTAPVKRVKRGLLSRLQFWKRG